MAATRINNVRYNLEMLTEYELDALLNHAETRATQAAIDIAKLRREQERRNLSHDQPLFDPWGPPERPRA